MQSKPWVRSADGVALDVRLTPRGGRDAIEGVERRADGRIVLKARVRAAPFEGQANEALCRLLAHELGLAPRRVEIAAGEGARIKRLRIAGDPQMLDAALNRLTKVSAQGGT
ncbi:MAG TPA: DUF167 family protein [Xanthobacteraceae bacterium]|nr:DUF167 family protein [Xanthobacteraceae bacterium]